MVFEVHGFWGLGCLRFRVFTVFASRVIGGF